MSRYIDADKFKRNLKTDKYGNTDVNEVGKAIGKSIVDVVEVRHGRWLRVGQSYIDPNKFLCFECSICGYTLDNHIKVEQNYCPNCGARMDGESDE